MFTCNGFFVTLSQEPQEALKSVPIRAKPSWQDVKVNNVKYDEGLLVTHVNQTHDLLVRMMFALIESAVLFRGEAAKTHRSPVNRELDQLIIYVNLPVLGTKKVTPHDTLACCNLGYFPQRIGAETSPVPPLNHLYLCLLHTPKHYPATIDPPHEQ